MTAHVECYSGSRYAERPSCSSFGKAQRLEIRQVLHSWRTPDGPGFRCESLRGIKPWFNSLYDEKHDSMESKKYDKTRTKKKKKEAV